MRDGGKGDLRRKLVVPEEVFNSNWDAIFGKNKKEDNKEEKKLPYGAVSERQIPVKRDLAKARKWKPSF